MPYQRINELVNGRRGMTPSTALRLAKYFGMSADFWMNLQLRWDLYHAQQSEAKELAVIQPYPVSAHAVGKRATPPNTAPGLCQTLFLGYTGFASH